MSEINWDALENPKENNIKEWPEFYVYACHICGCGTSAPAELLDETLRFCAMTHEEREKFPEWKEGCYRSAGHELAAKVLDHCDLVTHGTGIGWPWVTSKGEMFLRLLNEFKSKFPEEIEE